MSDCYDEESFDDSFESGSDSGPEQHKEQLCAVVSRPQPQQFRLPEPAPPEAVTGTRVQPSAEAGGGPSGSRAGYLFFSDQEDHENSALAKAGKSPKPRRRFKKPPMPSIGNIKDRIIKIGKFKKETAVFGVSLDTAIQRSILGTDGIEIPTVFRQCMDTLEENWLDHEGIYRLGGVKSKIEDLKSRYDKGDIVDLSECDPNVVASLLKLYLRELPEPIIPQRLIPKTEACALLPAEQQVGVLLEVMDDVAAPQLLLLGWLLAHMRRIAYRSSVNKMSLPNLIIVFSPTLQIPAPTLHLLNNHFTELFGDVEIKRYEAPRAVVELRKVINVIDLRHIHSLQTEDEITAEIERLAGVLERLHTQMTGKFDERDEYCWDLQRAITELRRKLKVIQKSSHKSPAHSQVSAEDEFLKTLTLMEATLRAENEELSARKEELQSKIRREVEHIEQFKKELKKYESLSRSSDHSSDDESGDDAELAKKIAALKWHGKEMEMRNRNLIKSIMEEEEAILQLKVKLKVLPLKHKLRLDE